MRKRSHLNRKLKITSIMTEPKSGLKLATITDAKSLYDALTQEQYAGAEKRAAMEICVIRDSVDSLGGFPFWVPTRRTPLTRYQSYAAIRVDSSNS